MPVLKKEVKQDLNQVSAIRIQEISEATKNNDSLQQKSAPAPVVETAEEPAETGSSKKYSDVIMARLTKGKRNVFKAFFSEYGITVNSGVEMCIEYVMDQVRAGNIKISKAGIK